MAEKKAFDFDVQVYRYGGSANPELAAAEAARRNPGSARPWFDYWGVMVDHGEFTPRLFHGTAREFAQTHGYTITDEVEGLVRAFDFKGQDVAVGLNPHHAGAVALVLCAGKVE